MPLDKRKTIAFAEQLIRTDPSLEEIGSHFKTIASDASIPAIVRYKAHILSDHFSSNKSDELLEEFIYEVKKA